MQSLNFEPSVLQKIYRLYLQINKILENFPKRKRYALGEKIENNLLELIELISLANLQVKSLREPLLYKTSSKIEVLKLLLRLTYDLKLINDRQYIELENKTQEIGKMIGGWIKYLRTQ